MGLYISRGDLDSHPALNSSNAGEYQRRPLGLPRIYEPDLKKNAPRQYRIRFVYSIIREDLACWLPALRDFEYSRAEVAEALYTIGPQRTSPVEPRCRRSTALDGAGSLRDVRGVRFCLCFCMRFLSGAGYALKIRLPFLKVAGRFRHCLLERFKCSSLVQYGVGPRGQSASFG